jgi:membrane-associated phospholipid phosphatase
MTGRRVPADVAAALGLLGVGGAVTVLVHVKRTRAVVQTLDDRWYALVQRSRSAPLDVASRTLDVAFGTTIDWSVRAAVTLRLVRRRRWAALAAWVATVVLGEVSVGPLKAFVDRIRPPDPRTTTSMMSYPSGHALAAATTAPGIVLALLPPGPARRCWLAVAVPLAGATAVSRTYLNAHWLSDVVGGATLGTGYALGAPRALELIGRAAPGTARRQRPARPGRRWRRGSA